MSCVLYRLIAALARLAVRAGRSEELGVIALRQTEPPALNDHDRTLPEQMQRRSSARQASAGLYPRHTASLASAPSPQLRARPWEPTSSSRRRASPSLPHHRRQRRRPAVCDQFVIRPKSTSLRPLTRHFTCRRGDYNPQPTPQPIRLRDPQGGLIASVRAGHSAKTSVLSAVPVPYRFATFARSRTTAVFAGPGLHHLPPTPSTLRNHSVLESVRGVLSTCLWNRGVT